MEIRPLTLEQRLAAVRALVFDFDGTLARLEIDFVLMRRRVLEVALCFGIDESQFQGRYLLETMAAVRESLAAGDPAAAGRFETEALAVVEDLEMEAAARGGLFPSTRPALRDLKESGYLLAVITRNFGRAVRTVFPDLPDFCSVFLPRETVPRVKPDPSHLLAALEALAVSSEQAIMVGDHPIDIETGRLAGTLTAGVASGRMSPNELAAAGADLVFDHVGQLAGHLLRNHPDH
ncbi:MAG: HAD family hydrolase [Thermodesulfobacteriota bacterium]